MKNNMNICIYKEWKMRKEEMELKQEEKMYRKTAMNWAAHETYKPWAHHGFFSFRISPVQAYCCELQTNLVMHALPIKKEK